MSARERRMKAWMGVAAAVAAVGVFGSGSAEGQQGQGDGRVPVRTKTTAKTPNPPSRTIEDDGPVPEGKVVRVPVNPGDAVAIINGETITRAALAEEAFIREGQKVLDAMISRKIVDQAMKARKLTVTAQEIDAEIDKYANNIAGVTREQWLANLQKEKKINPIQYKNDIIYPGLALKKLAEGRVQVTEKDMKDAFEAQFGERIRVRIIMTIQERDAVAMWNELKKNPGGFAHMAANDQRSVDGSTRVHGGLLEQALTRHAYPLEVSEKAFRQLVDGDPEDKDPAHKPKDGDMTGPIQVPGQGDAWILLKREGLIPAQAYNPKDETLRKVMKDRIFDAKLKEAMSDVFEELVEASQVDNKLTGQTKLAHEDRNPDHNVDGNVKLMSEKNAGPSVQGASAKARAAAANAVSPADREAADAFKKAALGDTPTVPATRK